MCVEDLRRIQRTKGGRKANVGQSGTSVNNVRVFSINLFCFVRSRRIVDSKFPTSQYLSFNVKRGSVYRVATLISSSPSSNLSYVDDRLCIALMEMVSRVRSTVFDDVVM